MWQDKLHQRDLKIPFKRIVAIIFVLGYAVAMGGYLRSPLIIIVGSLAIIGFMIWMQRDSPTEGLLRATPILTLAYLFALAQSLGSSLLEWFWLAMVLGLIGWVYRGKITHIATDVISGS
jgi:hypothetical protein